MKISEPFFIERSNPYFNWKASFARGLRKNIKLLTFHPIDYLRNGTILGGKSRYRILSEVGVFLGLSPINVYRIGRNFFDNCHENDLYNNKHIICRYAFVSVSSIKTFEPVFEYVKKGKVLDFGSGIGVCFDEIPAHHWSVDVNQYVHSDKKCCWR